MEVKNRIVMPAMETHLCDKEGLVTPEVISYYRARARGGVGYITVENTSVDPAGRINDGMLCIHEDRFIEGLKRLVEEVHRAGCKIVIQINHAGKEALKHFTGMESVAPSPIPSPLTRTVPRELTLPEVETLVERFTQGAERVLKAGADGVEIHMAHGYLVCQFLSPESNTRTDRYGENTEGRARFAVEIVKAIRTRVPKDFPVICRISADEYTEKGVKLDEGKVIARLLESAGASALHVSACNSASAAYNIPCYYLEEGCFIHLASGIKPIVKVPVITVGRILKPEMAEKVLEEGKADLISMGRSMIADPDWPKKVEEGRMEELRPCISCNRCIESIVEERLVCTVNPYIGREWELEKGPRPATKKVLVVGGGPAGLSAAAVAGEAGHKVCLWEKEPVLGGKYRYASMAPKKEYMKKFLDYLINRARKYATVIQCSREATVETIKEFAPEVVILAHGAKDEFLKIPGTGNNHLLEIRDAFNRAGTLGQNVAIIGGGPEGCELADYLLTQGKQVTIIEMRRMLGLGLVAHPRYHISERLKKAGAKILINTKVVEVGDGFLVVSRRGEDNQKLDGFDSIIMSCLHQPNDSLAEPLKKCIREVYVAGDAVQGRTALEAVAEGTNAALKL
jgi:2,4-dienoyl-CoA reductase-like NADH-dependent reductase (Old Yellow Enzyme family)/NADPH-dependent glutamate synthase beta subunit-like oxidoreductase